MIQIAEEAELNKQIGQEASSSSASDINGEATGKQLTNQDPGFKYPEYIYVGCKNKKERKKAVGEWNFERYGF
jgi:hypothetical protein